MAPARAVERPRGLLSPSCETPIERTRTLRHAARDGREARRQRTRSRASPSARTSYQTHSWPLRQAIARRWPPGCAAACTPNSSAASGV
eukprot:5931197-Prymnesium_polylepis.1